MKAAGQHEEALDILIVEGTVIDGTGAPRRRQDIGVIGNRIAAMGDLRHRAPRARRVIDARGHIVAPGFIDTHGHDDLMFIERPALEWKTSQGVTTVIVGNCGISAAPRPLPGNTAASLTLLGKTELHSCHETYLAELDRRRPMINVATLAGHANLRLAAMKDPAARPTEAEQALMRALLAQALRAGAIGMSTGLAYEPGNRADREELLDLARVLSEHDALHASHIRDEGDDVEAAVDEILDIGLRASCRTVISHHKCLMPQNWGRSRATLANIDRCRAAGLAVAMDVYPYNASSTILIPERAGSIPDIKITWSTPHPECGGRYLADIAREWGCGEEEAAGRLAPAGAIYFAMDEDEVRRILAHPCCMVGSDGLPDDSIPHPRLWGTFPRVLGRYVREMQVLTLEAAVAKMTSLPASVFGIADRGTLAMGAAADIVIFDPATICDRADWDRPTLPSVGIEHVFINGAAVYPRLTGPRPGHVLRRRQGNETACGRHVRPAPATPSH